MKIRTKIIINASKEKVWEILTDLKITKTGIHLLSKARVW